MNTKKTNWIERHLVDIITVLLIATIGGGLIWIGIITTPTNPPVTFDSQWMESFAEENGEDVIYWEIDMIDSTPCRYHEYTTRTKKKIHIYYECEDYSSGFEVIMNPETGRCTIWESGH